MYKIIFLLCSSFLLLSARENPFFPAKNVKQLNITSNQIQAYTPLQNIALSLPSSARILQEVTVKFINIDGSVGSKTLHVENSIDWHKPVIVSQSQNTITSKTSLKTGDIKIKHNPVKIISFRNFVTMKIFPKSVEITTKDKNIRHFMMVDPYRIVMDFKHNSDFLSYVRKINHSVCTSIAIGNHRGYYRIVLFLDGQYHFHFKTTKDGYNIHLY